jgi:hypothetical protein
VFRGRAGGGGVQRSCGWCEGAAASSPVDGSVPAVVAAAWSRLGFRVCGGGGFVGTGAVRSSGDTSFYKRFGGRGQQGTDGGRRGGGGAASTDERWAGLQVSVLLDGAQGKTSEDTVQERRRRRRRRRRRVSK